MSEVCLLQSLDTMQRLNPLFISPRRHLSFVELLWARERELKIRLLFKSFKIPWLTSQIWNTTVVAWGEGAGSGKDQVVSFPFHPINVGTHEHCKGVIVTITLLKLPASKWRPFWWSSTTAMIESEFHRYASLPFVTPPCHGVARVSIVSPSFSFANRLYQRSGVACSLYSIRKST